MRTALFGGTFDPIHNAHLAAAEAAADRFHLDRILFIPAGQPPHKTDRAITDYAHRLRMTEIACAADPRFEASRIEEGTSRSFSILTIEKYRRDHPGPLWFLIGADAFAEIRTWHRWEDVVRSVEFIVVAREGVAYDIPSDATVHELTGFDLPVSSSAIREQLRTGAADAPVPTAVLTYIREHGLYQSQLNTKFSTSSDRIS